MPKSHVPVVVCRSAANRTRGRGSVEIKPAAGGEPANSVSAEDRDLKQRRTGLFRLCWPSKGQLTEEASLSCRACGKGSPFSNRWLRNRSSRVYPCDLRRTAYGASPDRRRESAALLDCRPVKHASRLHRARMKESLRPPKS